MLISTNRPTSKRVTFEAIDNSMDVIDRILSSSSRRHGDLDVLSVGIRNEKLFIPANRKLVSRKGKVLAIGSPTSKLFQFRDVSAPTGFRRDGTGDIFSYAGSMGNSGYHKVDSFYGADAKGSFLVNPLNGTSLFVRSTTDLVTLSPHHRFLTVMNNGLNSPFSILVAALDQKGLTIDLQCQTHIDGGVRQRIIPFFKGWQGAAGDGFDVVLLAQRLDDDPAPRFEALPMRFSFKDGEWHVLVPDPQRFARATKVVCWQ